MKDQISIFWFRRDLRLEDNAGLFQALSFGKPVLCLFIFDRKILDKLKNHADARVEFIHQNLITLNQELKEFGSSLLVQMGDPVEIWKKLILQYDIVSVFINRDFEPYARQRDKEIEEILQEKKISFLSSKDQVIFEKDEIVKDDGKPYTVFSPYKRKWLMALKENSFHPYASLGLVKSGKAKFYPSSTLAFLSLDDIGFKPSSIKFPEQDYRNILENYAENRNFPAIPGTSRISVHLRFGTISIRKLASEGKKHSETWLSELIWREFYFMILWHFPRVVGNAFRPEYDRIPWRNSESDFQKWCLGETGYPLVDAGMRELNETGFMHNRVRMVVASFLTKHLLIDWRLGEAYFAEKLLDFELSSNNGGWQWAAGSGVDAAPYFRIFNPYEQEKKFDSKHEYIKRWVKEWNTGRYPLPMVEHKFARARCLDVYQKALKG